MGHSCNWWKGFVQPNALRDGVYLRHQETRGVHAWECMPNSPAQVVYNEICRCVMGVVSNMMYCLL
ncbi:hypothetical protein M404DRAFT_637017 [Pisolithus tinctorius Marx 270]|uniref:Uncharacterized protein n=1 Tax=Pisolithus tinctorius Marx 270 TaxID=870435 RepID=A0A0C3J5F9_PISTI|nr:hypothetical protein M404DRAFT_637017 [Pisolithus tinctorius Marx 270]